MSFPSFGFEGLWEADDFLKTGYKESTWSFSETSNRSFQNPLAAVHWFKTILEYVFRTQHNGPRIGFQ